MRTLLKPKWLPVFLIAMLSLLSQQLAAQHIIVNTAPLEGLDITPDNMWNFQIQSLETKDVRSRIEGSIRFRNNGHTVKYSFLYTLKPGMNLFDRNTVQPTWSYSSGALRELFTEHKVLPQGTYEYCVTVTPYISNSESVGGDKVDDCIYKQSEDLFSITLLEPEDNAKLYEYNPMFSWVATYPFLNELTYRIRVAEIKEGQNTANAITRNNPIYSESNLIPNSIVYPVYAKPLETWQPYAWTVDAYYKGILLGGAQPWRFTIVEDSEMVAVSKNQSYYDFVAHGQQTSLSAVGEIKLKYTLDRKSDTLSFMIMNEKNETVYIPKELPAIYGDNLLGLPVTDKLKHRKKYTLRINSTYGTIWSIPFIYYNPQFVK